MLPFSGHDQSNIIHPTISSFLHFRRKSIYSFVKLVDHSLYVWLGRNAHYPILNIFRTFVICFLLIGKSWENSYIDCKSSRSHRVCFLDIVKFAPIFPPERDHRSLFARSSSIDWSFSRPLTVAYSSFHRLIIFATVLPYSRTLHYNYSTDIWSTAAIV